MPLMTRKEIIDTYGFDPGDDPNTSVYQKGNNIDDVEPITLNIPRTNDAARQGSSSTSTDDQDTKETPSAPFLNMVGSGAIRGFISDPLLLAGMAVAGLEAAFTDNTFKEGLYKEGGLEKVQQHLQQYADSLPQGYSPEEKKRKIREYQASPEFFQFHTDQMASMYGTGMKMAATVNGWLGIEKTPEQETWQDDAAQILGSVVIPSPAIIARTVGKLAAATGKATPKLAELAAKGVDAVVLPGTSAAHYTPGVLASSTGVGLGINEVARGLSGDPTVTGGDAFTPRLPTGGFADPNTTDTSPRPVEVATSLAALATAAGVLSRAFRGKVDPPSLNPINSGSLSFDEQVIRNAERMGMEPPTDPGMTARLSAAINADSEVERLARDAASRAVDRGEQSIPPVPQGYVRMYHGGSDPTSGGGRWVTPDPEYARNFRATSPEGNEVHYVDVPLDHPKLVKSFDDTGTDMTAPYVSFELDEANTRRMRPLKPSAPNVSVDNTEREVQTALGMMTSRPARDAKIENLFDGDMPDGQRMSVTLRDITTLAQEADQASVDRYRFGMVARAAEDTRLKGLQKSQAEVDAAQTAVERAVKNKAHPNKVKELDIELQKKIDAHNSRLQDLEATRPNLQGWDDAKVTQYISDMMNDPVARKLHDMHVAINTELDQMLRRGGVMSQKEFDTRLRSPWHTAMFETRGRTYSAKEAREVLADPYELGVAVNQTIDPFQYLSLRAAQAIDQISFNQGKWRIINAIRAADPDGYYVREANEAGRNTVTVLDGGRERHFEFSRDSVVEALKFAPLSLGPIVQVVNTGRRWFQKLTTGPWLGGIPTAVNSLAYDIGAGYVTRREGRSFGYLGMQARLLAGDNKLANQLVDSLDFLDPTAVLQVGKEAFLATWYKTVGRVGEELMDAAMARGAFAGLAGRVDPQVLRNVGASMTRAYERSTVGVLRRAGAMQPHAMLNDTFGVKNRLERYAAEAINAGRDIPAWKNAVRTVAEPYLGLLDTIHNAARYAFYAQNYSILEHKYGRYGIPKAEHERLIEETRRLAGDIQAVGGSTTYNTGVAAIPYANIAAQATRHLYHAAFAQGSKHSFDVGLRLSGIAIAGYASIKLAEDMGAQDWYWNTQNQFERVGTILFPSVEAIAHKAKTGQWPQFDPQNPEKNFYRVRLAAELVPYTQAVLNGFEAIGLFNRGTNLGKQTPTEDFLTAVASAANVGNIPGINLLSLISGGPKLDFLNAMRGRPTAQDIKGPRGEGIFTGSLPSGIPAVVQEMAKSFLGFAGDVAIAMSDAGLQKYERSGKIFDSLVRAGDEVVQKVVTERMPSVPGLWKGESKVYTSTPVGSRIREVDALQKQLDEQYKMEYGRSQIRYPERPRVVDPEANAMLAVSHAFLSKGTYKKLADQLNATNAEISQLDAGKARLSPQDIQIQKRKLLMTARAQQEQLLSVIELHENTLKQSFGPLFKKYGQPATVEGARQILLQTTRKERTPA